MAGPGAALGRHPGRLPTGTTAVAVVGGETDAFVPSGSHLRVWADEGTGPWHVIAHVTVPIQYGSSS